MTLIFIEVLVIMLAIISEMMGPELRGEKVVR